MIDAIYGALQVIGVLVVVALAALISVLIDRASATGHRSKLSMREESVLHARIGMLEASMQQLRQENGMLRHENQQLIRDNDSMRYNVSPGNVKRMITVKRLVNPPPST